MYYASCISVSMLFSLHWFTVIVWQTHTNKDFFDWFIKIRKKVDWYAIQHPWYTNFFSSGDNIILLFQYPQHIRIDITEHMDILPVRRNWIPNKGMEYHPGLTERELPPAELDMGPTLSHSVTLRHGSGEGTEALRWILVVRAPSSRTSFSTIDIPGRWRTSEARQGPSRGQTIAAEGESQCTALLLISSIPLEYTFHYTPNAILYY